MEAGGSQQQHHYKWSPLWSKGRWLEKEESVIQMYTFLFLKFCIDKVGEETSKKPHLLQRSGPPPY